MIESDRVDKPQAIYGKSDGDCGSPERNSVALNKEVNGQSVDCASCVYKSDHSLIYWNWKRVSSLENALVAESLPRERMQESFHQCPTANLLQIAY